MATLQLNRRQYLELENLALGALAPLSGFMNEDAFGSVVEKMRLPGGELFPLPVVLDLSNEQAQELSRAGVVKLISDKTEVGEISVESVFTCDKESVAEQVFGTSDPNHPGVAHWFRIGDYFIGGPVRLDKRMPLEFGEYEMTPQQTRERFSDAGWKTIVGFQTRNVPHRAHEHLLRMALEQADGLFIQPLVGIKKRGDYTPMAILAGFRALIDGYLPSDRISLGVLSTTMRYAGPREALFHALIRRNYGCTHFIVGRDHAGVGDYYGKYQAQELTRKFECELGINILPFAGPFFCQVCDGIVTERTCPHTDASPPVIHEISGTDVRAALAKGSVIDSKFIRAEIVENLRGIQIFIDEDAE